MRALCYGASGVFCYSVFARSDVVIHFFVFFRYISVSFAQLFISYIHLTSSNESETGRGLLFLSAAILFYNVFFVFLEINLANSICLFFFSFATAILLSIVLNAQTPY